jgi:tetratricopeptide (TPR) repeat protein
MDNDNNGCGCFGELTVTALLALFIGSMMIISSEHGWLKAIYLSVAFVIFITVLGIIAGLIPILGQYLYIKYSSIAILRVMSGLKLNPLFSLPDSKESMIQKLAEFDLPKWLQWIDSANLSGTLAKFGYRAGFLVSLSISLFILFFLFFVIIPDLKNRKVNKAKSLIEKIRKLLNVETSSFDLPKTLEYAAKLKRLASGIKNVADREVIETVCNETYAGAYFTAKMYNKSMPYLEILEKRNDTFGENARLMKSLALNAIAISLMGEINGLLTIDASSFDLQAPLTQATLTHINKLQKQASSLEAVADREAAEAFCNKSYAKAYFNAKRYRESMPYLEILEKRNDTFSENARLMKSQALNAIAVSLMGEINGLLMVEASSFDLQATLTHINELQKQASSLEAVADREAVETACTDMYANAYFKAKRYRESMPYLEMLEKRNDEFGENARSMKMVALTVTGSDDLDKNLFDLSK